MPDLEQDTTLRLPRVTVLKASAGSGKTFRLTQRYAQFLLSEKIPKNELRNLMAITFSNNASGEMRNNVLEWLKFLCLGEPERIREMEAVTAGGAERLSKRAGELIDTIMSRFSEFQVRTIDSFMASVFRASALDFGFGPDFEVVLDPQPLVDYAWNLFLREAHAGSANASLLDRTIESVLDFKTSAGTFAWDPSTPLLAEIRKVEEKLSNMDETPLVEDPGLRQKEFEHRVSRAFETVEHLVRTSGLQPRASSTFERHLAEVRTGRFSDLLSGSMKSGPVKKPPRGSPGAMEAFERIESAWAHVGDAVNAYAGAWARAYYQPFLRLHRELSASLERVKRGQAKVFIGDIGRRLGDYLRDEMIPDVYFRIGERVWHYLVDEFQDTSPLQWRTLFPLVENSLAMGGSLFVVGDTKQAIYGFRQADYTIMRALEAASPFPSAPRDVRELSTNWRSRPRVIALAQEVFTRRAAALPKYQEAARRSGLDDWHQEPRAAGGPGYVEVEVLARDDENPPEREKLRQIMEDLQSRGYGWGDIALLAQRNADVVRATSWLNDMGVPFISFSSLDVRTRPVAGEMLALLSFLDSPPDDLAFATFVLGRIFTRTLAAQEGPDAEAVRGLLFDSRTQRPLYKAFQRKYPGPWKACFAGLFRSAGYLPLYDLVSEACARFDVFSLVGEEEATLAKLLEVVKEFEGSGANSLREFLGAADETAGADNAGKWAIDVPRSAPSVNAMTIHKAKGLGFPVVVVLLYGESSHRFEYTVLREGDDESLGSGLRLVKLTQDLARRDPVLGALYDAETMKADVDRLNRLYVALTRAKREMYVIGVKGARDTYPFDLLPAESFPPSPEKGRPESTVGGREPAAALSHHARPVPLSFSAGRLSREERRRGELAHRIMELTLHAGPDLPARLASAAARAAREMRTDVSEAGALVPNLLRMLAQPDLAACFTPGTGRTISTEQELCDADGHLFRMDRIVVDPGRVTVIDFKTGAEEPAPHEAQVRDYMRVLSEVYPAREVSALLAYVDLAVVRSIR
jgi:ATP-dependent helicase/nuclease subunit A